MSETAPENSDLTRCLNAASTEERQAAEEQNPLVYGELRKLAAWHLHRETAAQSLQATALVHEADLRLSPGEPLAVCRT